jgi:Skp family chaperone for outer membrane proteins
MRKVYVILILLVGFVLGGKAQSRSFQDIQKRQRERFAQMKSAQQAEFDEFRKECNDRYAEMMRKHWELFDACCVKNVKRRMSG